MVPSDADDCVPNSFDEIFERQLLQLEHETDSNELPRVPGSNDLEGSVNSSQATACSHRTESSNPSDPWRKGLWCMGKKIVQALDVDKGRKNWSEPAYVSPTHLLNDNSLAIRSPHLPSQTTVKSNRSMMSPSTVPSRPYRQYRQEVREQTTSPSPTYARNLNENSMKQRDSWQQHLENFHLHTTDDCACEQLVTKHGRFSNGERLSRQQNATSNYNLSSMTQYHYPFSTISHATGHNSSQAQASEVAQHYYCNNHQDRIWTAEGLTSSDGSNYSQGSYESQYSGEGFINPLDQQLRHTAMSPIPDQAFPIGVAMPQNAIQNTANFPHDALRSGLGIHYPSPDEIGCAIPYKPIEVQQIHLGNLPQGSQPLEEPYPALLSNGSYDTVVSTFNSSPTFPQHYGLHSRSPSPISSPTNFVGSRKHNQQSPSRCEYPQNRRKSIHKTGPIKENSTTASPPKLRSRSQTQGQLSQQQRNRSRPRSHSRSRSVSSKPTRTPRTPTSSTTSNFDFVNFTPKDSAKLMSDVAPSGSSKTRARREQEAKEKRKKLGEAAMLAVRRAGGDVNALQRLVL